jgi:hypothetical protein
MVSRRIGALTEGLRPDHINMHLAPPADECDQTWHLSALDIAGHNIVHARKPRLGQSYGARRLFPPFCFIGMVVLGSSCTSFSPGALHLFFSRSQDVSPAESSLGVI